MEFDGRDEWLPSERKTSRRYETWRSRWLDRELEERLDTPTWREIQPLTIEWEDVVREHVRAFDAAILAHRRTFDARPRLIKR